MRDANRNKQTLHYALYKANEPIYKLDDNGNKIVVYTDTSTTPPTEYYEEVGRTDVYEKPVEFRGNIALSGGDSVASDYGVNLSDYEAILITEKDLTPIKETTLIWHNNEPTVGADGHPDPETADYRVLKVKPSLNQDRFILAKVVKNGES